MRASILGRLLVGIIIASPVLSDSEANGFISLCLSVLQWPEPHGENICCETSADYHCPISRSSQIQIKIQDQEISPCGILRLGLPAGWYYYNQPRALGQAGIPEDRSQQPAGLLKRRIGLDH